MNFILVRNNIFNTFFFFCIGYIDYLWTQFIITSELIVLVTSRAELHYIRRFTKHAQNKTKKTLTNPSATSEIHDVFPKNRDVYFSYLNNIFFTLFRR